MKTIVYDTETTGTRPWEHEIIQIAAIAYDITPKGWAELGRFEIKLKFDLEKASPEALEKNCYNRQVWENEAVSSFEAIKRFDAFVNDYRDVRRESKRTGNEFFNARTCAHNLKFDDEFVRKWYKKHDMFCPFDFSEVYCTYERAKWKVNFDVGGMPNKPENYRLETLCKFYGIELNNAHDAMADVQATAQLAWHLMQ